MEQSIKLGVVYEHFKGNSYKVLFFAKDSETREDIVIYMGLYAPYTIWARPLKEFKEYMEDKEMFRFVRSDGEKKD